MHEMNSDWVLSFQSHNQDFAIRQFCAAARMIDQEQQQQHSQNSIGELYTYTSTPDHSASSQEEQEFVDSFFNIDSYDKDPLDQQVNLDVEEFGDFTSMILNEYSYKNLSVLTDEEPRYTVLEACSSSDDLIGAEKPFDAETISHDHVEAEVNQGLQLVHLLLACAEAVGCRDTRLSDSLLTQIWPAVTPFGDSLQRVSYCFALGLQSRLTLLQHRNNAGATLIQDQLAALSRVEKREAYHWLNQITPYMAFGFMAANDAICKASSGKECLHIIDLGMLRIFQWQSLIRTLTAQPDSPPPRLVRITGILEDTHDFMELELGLKSLMDEVAATSSGNIRLEFQVIKEPVSASLFTREKLDVREGEALIVNSVMQLHKYVKESRGSLKTILQAIKKLGPALVIVVEQDANHNGPFFLGRFLESLHYYSAVFDSLEASLPRDSTTRIKIEKCHYAEEIRNIVAYEGSNRIERHERADQWRRQLGRAGFQVVGLKCMSQVRMMLSVYGSDGYTLASEKGCLLLGWKGRPIMFASAWEVHNVASS
ncbi:GRAS family protein RAD1-like [Nicotiana tabacum]|uniref:DELLA protein RGL1-like n=1 Tax=Nicotiana tabacum TaxID=4097 RepID=A0A1S4D5B6_TOBAC|nr:GRAS family protein RAM1-like [Nicotiana tomentosiformis]XP_016508607.1 PREDICTED: DELLA protein RGL1-like [Nicotiana tabacum]